MRSPTTMRRRGVDRGGRSRAPDALKQHGAARRIEADQALPREEHRRALAAERRADRRRVAGLMVGRRPQDRAGRRVEGDDPRILAVVAAADVGDDAAVLDERRARRAEEALAPRRNGARCRRSRRACRRRDRARAVALRRRTCRRDSARRPARRAALRRSRNRRGRWSDTRTATAGCRFVRRAPRPPLRCRRDETGSGDRRPRPARQTLVRPACARRASVRQPATTPPAAARCRRRCAGDQETGASRVRIRTCRTRKGRARTFHTRRDAAFFRATISRRREFSCKLRP